MLFYWQPTVFQKQRHSAVEAAAAAKRAKFGIFLEVVYDRIRGNAGLAADSSFRVLSEIFAQEANPLFMDCCHLGEVGNKMVAQHIVKDVLEVLAAAGKKRRQK